MGGGRRPAARRPRLLSAAAPATVPAARDARLPVLALQVRAKAHHPSQGSALQRLSEANATPQRSARSLPLRCCSLQRNKRHKTVQLNPAVGLCLMGSLPGLSRPCSTCIIPGVRPLSRQRACATLWCVITVGRYPCRRQQRREHAPACRVTSQNPKTRVRSFYRRIY